MAVRIEVDGETYEKRVDTPIGHEKRPMPDDQLEAKMTDMAREVLTDDQIERAIDRCYGLHQRDRVDDLLDALVI